MITEQQKRAWGRLVILYEMSGDTVSKISLCQTLIYVFWTGVLSEGYTKEDLPIEYIQALAEAKSLFNQLTSAMQAPERGLWRESEATRICQSITELLMPRCVLNQYILIDASSFSPPTPQDSTKEDFSLNSG